MRCAFGCHPLIDMSEGIAIVTIIHAAKALEFVIIKFVDVFHLFDRLC